MTARKDLVNSLKTGERVRALEIDNEKELIVQAFDSMGIVMDAVEAGQLKLTDELKPGLHAVFVNEALRVLKDKILNKEFMVGEENE